MISTYHYARNWCRLFQVVLLTADQLLIIHFRAFVINPMPNIARNTQSLQEKQNEITYQIIMKIMKMEKIKLVCEVNKNGK